MNIDDQLRNKSDTYTIIHKLGFGPSSTVWLAKLESETTSKVSFHALKVLRGNAGTPDWYSPELKALERLEQTGQESHAGLIHVQDRFTIDSVNGKHYCVVLPFLGPNLSGKRVLDAMSCETRRNVCEQLAHAVNYIHAFDICHSGEFEVPVPVRTTRVRSLTFLTDLTPINVLFKIPGIENISEASLRRMLTPVVSHTVTRVDGKPLSNMERIPRCVIETAGFQDLDFHSLKKVAIINFGRSFNSTIPPPTFGRNPTSMVFPELLFRYPASKKSDIWQLACLLFLVQAQALPFQISTGYDHLLAEMTAYLGPIPYTWARKYQWNKYKIVLPSGTTCDWDLEECFNIGKPTRSLETRMVGVEGRRAQKMAALLHKMLAWEPENRPESGWVYQDLLQLRLSG